MAMSCNKFAPPPRRGDFDENWRMLYMLGEGSFAQVYAVEHVDSSQCAAIKIPKQSCEKCELDKEARIWKQIGRHDHIVNLIGAFENRGMHVIMMEKCDCSLGQMILDMPSCIESSIVPMFHQMASAVAHLEILSIAHRDIKPDNFLSVGRNQALKLCDFGFAKEMPKFGKLYGTFGTPRFMSPEMVGDGPHDLKTDVWSLGATWYRMLYGESPYAKSDSSAKGVMKAIAVGYPEPTFEGRCDVGHEVKDAIAALLHRPVSTRISANEALELPCMRLATERFPTKSSTVSNAALDEVSSESTCDIGSRASESTFTDYYSELASPKYLPNSSQRSFKHMSTDRKLSL
jgi:serine/threonine protein kinase